MITLISDKSDLRLDVFLSEILTEFSRSKNQQLIKDGFVKVNGKKGKASYIVQIGDKIEVEMPEIKEIELIPEPVKLDIRYEDNDILVINKPKNMLTHPTEQETEGTLVNALLYNFKTLSDINGKMRPGIVHRLDRDTSGLIFVAKTNKGHLYLEKQIKEKTAIREYYAVVKGYMKEPNGVINLPIDRNPKNPTKMAVVEGGKPSVTKYETIETFKGYSLLKLTLLTGRTHQIRVHLSHLKHPIVNDTLYGGEKLKINTTNQVLQAFHLNFTNLQGKNIDIKIDFDEDLSKTIKYLRGLK
ncbi:RluA family pseudouridine synthase [bacterium]|nr:RluA family pseudouridine synthase [bacterium]